MTLNWFRAGVIFNCPFCQKQSTEQIIASADKHNPDQVAEAIRRATKPLTCQNCKKVAPEGIQVHIGMNDLTPEEISKISPSSDKLM